MNQLSQDIRTCIDWSELKYNTFQFNTGMQYLEARYGATRAREFARTKSFWMWWARQWEKRDREFFKLKELNVLLPMITNGASKNWPAGRLAEEYCSYHRYDAIETFPSRVVSRLIRDEINKNLTIK